MYEWKLFKSCPYRAIDRMIMYPDYKVELRVFSLFLFLFFWLNVQSPLMWDSRYLIIFFYTRLIFLCLQRNKSKKNTVKYILIRVLFECTNGFSSVLYEGHKTNREDNSNQSYLSVVNVSDELCVTQRSLIWTSDRDQDHGQRQDQRVVPAMTSRGQSNTTGTTLKRVTLKTDQNQF